MAIAKPKIALKPLNINDLTRNKDLTSIYVINSSRNTHEGGGEVFLAVADFIIKIPNTWIPIDITAFAPAADIMRSRYFLEAVRKNLLTLVSEEYFDSVMEDPTAKKEYDRIQILARNVSPDEQSKLLAEAGLNVDNEESRKLAPGEGFESKASPRVVSIVNNAGYDAGAKTMGLINIEESLTMDDLHYIFAKSSEDSIKEWAMVRLKERQSSVPA